MSEFEIRKGLAMPNPQRHRNERFPFGDLAEGDCLQVDVSLRKTINNHAQKFRMQNPGFKFNGRTVGDKFFLWCTKRPDQPAHIKNVQTKTVKSKTAAKPAGKGFLLDSNAQISKTIEAERKETANETGARLRQIASIQPSGTRVVKER